MADARRPLTSYERKIKLIIDISTDGSEILTPEQYALELQVAKNILQQLGVKP